jgi:hypothetical protein
VNDHPKQVPPVPPVSVLRQWIGVPDLLTEVTATHVVIIVLAELRVWYFKAAFYCLSRKVVRNLGTI